MWPVLHRGGRRNADTSTPSKQRDRHGVTQTTHHSDSQPSHSDSTGRRQAHPRAGAAKTPQMVCSPVRYVFRQWLLELLA